MPKTDLGSLSKKRNSIKAKLTSFADFINVVHEKINTAEKLTDYDVIEVEQRLKRGEPLINEFDETQTQIEGVTTEFDKEYGERVKFEQTYYNATAKAKVLLNYNSKKEKSEVLPETLTSAVPAGAQANSSNTFGLNSIKLPTIKLPKFSGSYQDWLEFRDTFESLINANVAISDIQKYHYLKASLEGDAAQVIKSLEMSASNYQIAWKTINERFDNKRLLVHNHVKNLFNLELIRKGSSEKIRKLMDTISKNLRSLEQLNQPVSEWDTLLVYMIATKLDNATARDWEKFRPDREIPTLENLKEFLKSKADLLETLEINCAEKRAIRQQANTKSFFVQNNNCAQCKKDHLIQNCGDFLKLTTAQRASRVKELKLCINCLRRGHFTKTCRLGTCKKCNSKRHTLLHEDKDNLIQETNKISVALTSCVTLPQVLLSTAYIHVLDVNHKAITVRALLDSGSQSSFITDGLGRKLNLEKQDVNRSVSGLNCMNSKVSHQCEVIVQSMRNAFSAKIKCLVLPEITGFLPSVNVKLTDLQIPPYLKLADPTFHKPGKIDILIGADLFWQLICVGQKNLGDNKPVLQKTKFGWIVSGAIGIKSSETTICHFPTTNDVNDQLARFWELEECVPHKQLSKEEIACEKHYVENIRRNDSGKFIVSIPFKEPLEKLGESFEQAERRFRSLERKLQYNQTLNRMYAEFVNEYKALGHMIKIEKSEHEASPVYYMPHHGVLRAESLTTKLRVVFDASAPTTSGYSLNNLQMTGPTIQEDLHSILLRFRTHNFVVAADVAKMYRQVLVTEAQRPLQRILWRDQPEKPLEFYQLNTVTYGTTSAPFLAIRCLFELAQENKEIYPTASKVIEHDFYVDDLLSGARTVEEAATLCSEVSAILKLGGFDLRKFYSNDSRVIQHLGDNSDARILKFGKNDKAKTLGLNWCPENDELMYIITEDGNKSVTKRAVLSKIAQIFDPLGLLAPCTILAKIIMQKVWLQKLTWDESLPQDLHTAWTDFKERLPLLNNLCIRRRVICKNLQRIELHGFADASENAYGACIYICRTDQNGEIFSNLLCAKTKVAPLKTITIPILELCAALVLIRLIKKVRESLRLTIDNCILWTDSTIVLSWLKTSPNCLKPFVSNRVAEVQELSVECYWRHVPSGDNPADILSRGICLSRINEANLWWYGPDWLKREEEQWPTIKLHSCETPDLRKNLKLVHGFNKYRAFVPIRKILKSYASKKNSGVYAKI